MRISIIVLCMAVLAIGCKSRTQVSEQNPSFEKILKIDVHTHVLADVPGLPEMMREKNLRMVNLCTRGSDPEYVRENAQDAENLFLKYKPLFYFASTFGLAGLFERGYTEKVIGWLDTKFENGALMVKIWKEIGMEIKTPSGAYLMPDDPLFDPIYEYLINKGKPLICHLAEPIDCWRPLNPTSPHYAYYSQHPEWHFYNKPGVPSYEQIIEARDNILKRHPGLIVIGAHMGSMSHDVDEVAKRFDAYRNFYVDVSARTKDLACQSSEKVRNFFIKYQDRILYGTDIIRRPNVDDSKKYPVDQQASTLKQIEDIYRLDYRYYAESGTLKFYEWETRCLELPREVLEKFYYKNAQRLLPGLAQ